MEKTVEEQTQIKKMRTKKEKTIEALTTYQINQIEGLIDAIEASGLEEFMEYIRSPWKMLWPNFIAGIARGFGALVGATIVIALVGWILSTIIDLPLIGKQIEPYVNRAQEEFQKFTEANNYRPHFEKIEETLNGIQDEIHLQNQMLRNIEKTGTNTGTQLKR